MKEIKSLTTEEKRLLDSFVRQWVRLTLMQLGYTKLVTPESKTTSAIDFLNNERLNQLMNKRRKNGSKK